MGTAINSIFTWVAALAPAVSSDAVNNVTVEGYANIRSTLQIDDLPLRKIMTFGDESESEYAYVALGNTVQVTWRIVDRYFHKFANTGQGWQDFSDELTKYTASYVNALQADRSPTTQSHVLSVRFVPQIFDFVDKKVAGVDVILEIQEVC
jgi:hypothetical protein